MLKALRERVDQKDEGFTLIELMVVVLIIGILMAIAIPTFLGAKSKANDRAAQENARNALTAEKTYFVDNQQYATAAQLTTANLEPALSFQSGASAGGTQVQVTVHSANSTNDQVVLSSQSAANNCFYILDEGLSPSGSGLPAGTYYASQKGTCASATMPAIPTAAVTQANAAFSNNWALAW